jgi:hypothetical protein
MHNNEKLKLNKNMKNASAALLSFSAKKKNRPTAFAGALYGDL